MTETLINITIIVAALYGASYTPWISRRLGRRPATIQNLLFKAMAGLLYVFSLHETIDEDGLLYGVAFSLIPLVAGIAVLGSVRSRQAATSQPAPILGAGIGGANSAHPTTTL